MMVTFAWPWPDGAWVASDAFAPGATFRVNVFGDDMGTGRLVRAENRPDERRTLLTVEIDDDAAPVVHLTRSESPLVDERQLFGATRGQWAALDLTDDERAVIDGLFKLGADEPADREVWQRAVDIAYARPAAARVAAGFRR